MDKTHTLSGLNPWRLVGWLVLAAIFALAVLTVLGAPRYGPEFAVVGIIVAAWAVISLAAIQLYRRIGGRHSKGAAS
jgi:hypothetical protein